MNLWIRHPRSKEPDAMLTLAVSGFLFCTQFAGTALFLAYRAHDPSYLNNVAAICGLILAPTLGAYVARKQKDSPNAKDKSDDNLV